MKKYMIISALVVHSIPAFASEFQIGELSYQGSGCPQGSIQTQVNQETGKVLFRVDSIQTQARTPKFAYRQDCTIKIPVQVSSGYSLAALPMTVIERAREVLKLHERAEHTVSEELAPPQSKQPKPLQIQLFEPVNYNIAERIRNLKVDELRPIEALQLLAELQQELRRG